MDTPQSTKLDIIIPAFRGQPKFSDGSGSNF